MKETLKMTKPELIAAIMSLRPAIQAAKPGLPDSLMQAVLEGQSKADLRFTLNQMRRQVQS